MLGLFMYYRLIKEKELQKMTQIQVIKEYLAELIQNINLELDYLILDIDNGKIKEDHPNVVRAFTRLSAFQSVYYKIEILEAKADGI